MPPLHQHHPETKDTLLEYIDKLALYYDQFAYHNMEKKLEQKTFDRILEEMKPYVDVLFLYDYKMGVKPMSAEESQQKYYGKSSESWFGCAVIWRNADGTYHLQFFDVFARNGGAQGGFMVCMSLRTSYALFYLAFVRLCLFFFRTHIDHIVFVTQTDRIVLGMYH